MLSSCELNSRYEATSYTSRYFLAKEPVSFSTASLSHIFLRKEVIQPHLPIRLPCYDFTPVIDFTLGSSLSYELGH